MTDAIFHISKIPFSLISIQKLTDHCVKNAKDQDPTNRSVRLFVMVSRYLILVPQRWVEWYFPPHLVFVVSP